MKAFLLLLLSITLSAPCFAQVAFSPVTVSFPHIDIGGDAAGLNYATLVQAVNDNSAPTNGHITLFSDSGNVLSASFDGNPAQSAFDFSLQSGATRQIEVSLNGAVTPGWMRITYTPSDAETTVLIQYRAGATVLTEVGVQPSYSSLASTDFPAETDAQVNTGIAIANPNTTSARFLVRLWDPATGNPLASTTILLPSNGHIGKFLTELFANAPAVIRTQVSLDSCMNSACTTFNGLGFIATALRINSASSTFTAIPVLQRPTGGALVRVLPQVVVGGNPSGGNYQTILYMSTSAANGVTGVADVLDDNGTPIPVSANGISTGGHFSFTLAGDRAIRILLSSSGAVQPGWVRLTLPASVPLIVNIVFQTYSGSTLASEASVLDSAIEAESLIYVSSTSNTGVALANPQSTPNTVNLTLYDNSGAIADTQSVTLPAYGHLARFVSELFPHYGAVSDFNGSLSIHSPMGFSAVALRLIGSSIAALPVADSVMFRPSITNVRIIKTQGTTGQVTFSIDVSDNSADVVSGGSTIVSGTAGIYYPTQNFFDGHSLLLDGTTMINATSGTLTGTFQGLSANTSSGTPASFYIAIQDSLGNYSNLISIPFTF